MATPLTALARPIDPGLPSNRLPLIAAGVVAVTVTAVLAVADGDAGLAGAAGRGVRCGVGTFLAWAVARELDPDRPLAARNAVLAFPLALFLGVPALAAVGAVLLAARVVVRSTGAPPTPLDLLVLVGLAGFAASSAPGFVAGLALAWAVLEDARLAGVPVQLRDQLGALAIGVAAVTVSVVTGSFLTTWRAPGPFELVWIALVAIAVAVRPRPVQVTSHDDRGCPLTARRVARASLLVLVTLALALLWAGADAVPALAPAAAAVIGTGVAAPRWLRARELGTPLDPPTGAAP